MNILLINHYAGSPIHGMEFRPHYFAAAWVKAGHKVTIVAASYSHVRSKQPQMSGESVCRERLNGVNYIWLKTSRYRGNGIGRVINIVQFLYALRKNTNIILNEINPDITIASSTYPMDIWVTNRIAKLSNSALLYEVHDLWPLSPIELGGMSKWHPFIIWAQWAENFAYRSADAIISMLPLAKKYMISHGMKEEKYNYVPNGIDVQEWNEPSAPVDHIIDELNDIKAKSKLIICYAGTLGLANDLNTLLEAAAILKNDFSFVIVGSGPEENNIRKIIQTNQLNNVHLFSAIPKKSIPWLLSLIDVAYIGLLPQPLFRFGISPNKLMDYMMAECPVVMAIHSGNDPVTDAECGYTVEPGNPDLIATAMRNMLSLTKEQRIEMGKRGRKYVTDNHDYEQLACEYLKIMETTINKLSK